MINELNNRITSLAREINAKVEHYDGSTLALLATYTGDDALVSIDINRTGAENYFFGIYVSQKLTLKLLDRERQKTVKPGDFFKVYFTSNTEYILPYPNFYAVEIARNENTNDLTITAKDAVSYKDIPVANPIPAPYTLKEFADFIAQQIGMTVQHNVEDGSFDTVFPNGANFDNALTIAGAVEDIAEATQTIAYANSENKLCFKRLSQTPVAAINRDLYKTLTTKNKYTLSAICRATSLGDNIIVSNGEDGETQYVRDNIFWTAEGIDIPALLDKALLAIGGSTTAEYTCDWRGNYAIEPGDIVSLQQRDELDVNVPVINSTLSYNGGLSDTISCEFKPADKEDATPADLGDVINETFAKVDKVNKQIDIVAGEVKDNQEQISALRININSISASVEDNRKATEDGFAGVNDDITALNKRVDATMTSEDVKLEISKELENGVDKVVTKTGFRFDEEGMTVSKSGKAMTTTITEDGMRVSKNNETTLTANSTGVDAVNLHATTYLIIGENSRFEDVGDRTACFYIGR